MKHALAFTLFASAAVGFAQQNKDPVSSVVKEILPHQEKNLVAAVDEMPATKFGYKPTPQTQLFGWLRARGYSEEEASKLIEDIDANGHVSIDILK